MDELIRKAHGLTLPDNWCYQFIRDALEAIADALDEDLEDSNYNADASMYDSELLAWLASSSYRKDYVEQYVKEFGLPDASQFSLTTLIGSGQWLEMKEVYDSVLESLQEIVEELEDGSTQAD